jgi:predicted acetyltransferase
MSPRQASPSAGNAPETEVTLAPVSRDDAPVLRNLFELYVHDFSEHVPLELQPSGRFDVPLSDVWWTRDDHFPFFVRHRGKLAGFALVRRGSRVTADPDIIDFAEFFVARGVRRRGVGRAAAHAAFRALTGRWEVRVRGTNAPARAFWAGAVEAWAGRPVVSEPFSSGAVEWEVFRIESPA